jgi:hypothetical protein
MPKFTREEMKQLAECDVAELDRETTRAVIHQDCEGGVPDHKPRLYITRTAKDVFLAYCHNCQKGGMYKPDGYVPNIYSPHHTEASLIDLPSTDHLVQQLQHYLKSWHSIPVALSPAFHTHKEYMDKWELDYSLCRADNWGVGFGQILGKLDYPHMMWPCFEDTKMIGVQLKPLYTVPADIPKVRTLGHVGTHIFNPYDSPILVICEDRVSGVKIAQAGFAACVLHGASVMSLPEVHKLSCMFDKAVVWLDMDNPTILKAARETTDRLRIFMKNVGMLTPAFDQNKMFDPKYFSVTDIQDFVDGVLGVH